jgi:hypothetical protein
VTTALIVHPGCFAREPYSRPTETEAQRLAIAFSDGSYVAAAHAASRIFPEMKYSAEWNALHNALQVSYPEIRDYLIHDCDVDWRVATRIALRLTKPLRRIA